MKKIMPIVLVGILVLSRFGAVAFFLTPAFLQEVKNHPHIHQTNE